MDSSTSPENLTMPYVLPNDGEVVGIGQPVAIRFDEDIPNRLAAQEATTSLLTARAAILERLKYSKRLLGMAADPNVPETLPLKHPALTEENFDSVYQTLVAQYDKRLTIAGFPNLNIAGAASPSQQSGASGSGISS